VQDFRCDYLVYQDQPFQDRFFDVITSFKGEGGVYAPLCRKHGKYPKNMKAFKLLQTPCFDLRKGLYSGNNTGTLAISVAIALGFTDIYLLGMDCRFSVSEEQAKKYGITDERFITEQPESHYHGGYRHTKGKNQDEAFFASMIWAFRTLGEYVRDNRKDVNLYNCSELSIIDLDEEYGYKNITIQEALGING
jgi:hypothetical protein